MRNNVRISDGRWTRPKIEVRMEAGNVATVVQLVGMAAAAAVGMYSAIYEKRHVERKLADAVRTRGGRSRAGSLIYRRIDTALRVGSPLVSTKIRLVWVLTDETPGDEAGGLVIGVYDTPDEARRGLEAEIGNFEAKFLTWVPSPYNRNHLSATGLDGSVFVLSATEMNGGPGSGRLSPTG